MAYADLLTIQSLNVGDVLTAACLQQIRANGEFFVDPPVCSVYHSTTQSVANAALHTFAADSEHFDNDSIHSTSTNNSRLTIQTAGRYLFIAGLEYAAHATGSRSLLFLHNGTTTYNANQFPTVSGVTSNVTGARAIVCAAGDYVEAQGFQTSGGPLYCTLNEFLGVFMTR